MALTNWMYANVLMLDTAFWDSADTPTHTALEAVRSQDGVLLTHEAASAEYVGFRDFRSTATGLALFLPAAAKITGVKVKHPTRWFPEAGGGGG